MFKPSNLSALFIALCTSGLALNASAQSVDLKVTGTITPAACLPTIAGGGVIDLGPIGAATLNQTSPTQLGNEERNFSIACDAPTKVAIKLTDNRSDSVVEGIIVGTNPAPGTHFGLGKAGTANIGAMSVSIPNVDVVVDSEAADTLRSDDAGTTWTSTGTGAFHSVRKGVLYTWGEPGTMQPIAFENLSTPLHVRVAADRGASLPLGDEITLDGSATIELVYL